MKADAVPDPSNNQQIDPQVDTDSNLSDACARIERDALRQAEKTGDPDLRLKWINIAKAIRERCKTVVDEANAKCEEKNAQDEIRHRRLRFVATTLTPVLSLLIAVAVLIFQGVQFGITSKNQEAQFSATSDNQAKQFKATAKLQADQGEDAKWQEAMKAVSLSDPKASFVGALSMQAFFRSQRYGTQSQLVASALLPNVDTVTGFDEIFDDLIRRIPEDQQYQITGISSMLLMSAREEHHIDGPTIANSLSVTPDFLKHDVTSIDPNPNYKSESQLMRDKVHAWELDSVSQGMHRLWTDRGLKPDKYLVSVVLENADFKKRDFSGANLTKSVLLDAHFEGSDLHGATLSGASLRNVFLDGADLSAIEIKKFEGSVWSNVNWWRAKCVSPQLYVFLAKVQPIPANEQSAYSKTALTRGCGKN